MYLLFESTYMQYVIWSCIFVFSIINLMGLTAIAYVMVFVSRHFYYCHQRNKWRIRLEFIARLIIFLFQLIYFSLVTTERKGKKTLFVEIENNITSFNWAIFLS